MWGRVICAAPERGKKSKNTAPGGDKVERERNVWSDH